MDTTVIAGKDMRDAFFDEMYELAKADSNVVFITDDMDAFSLRKFKKDFPERFINIGVAEQNMIDVAAGLAVAGKRVYVYGICTFVTMRCLEQIKFSLCSMNLPVTIVGVGAGFSFSFDGPTHHGTQDVAIMRALPEMTIYNPSDAVSAAAAAHLAHQSTGPVYVRLDKGVFPVIYPTDTDATAGYRIVKELSTINLISTGFMTSRCLQVYDELKKSGITVGLVDVYRLKALPKELLGVLRKSTAVVTVEEHSAVGGLGALVSELITGEGLSVKLKKIAVPDRQFIQYGSREWLHKISKLDVGGIAGEVISFNQ